MLIGKNKWKMGKKALCLIFTFLFSINSFAAVVSDNDGSAFITKAEFDSLKNNFQSQLDSYNTGIDNKIDNAIASYLAGIKVSKKTTYDIIYKDSDTEVINFMNGYIYPEYARPTMNIFNNVQVMSKSGAVNNAAVMGSWGFTIDNTWSSEGTNRRPLLGLVSGSEASIGSIYWRGIALKYHEYYEMANTNYYVKDSWASGIDRPGNTHYIQLSYPCVIDYNGYNANIDYAILNSQLTIQYYNNYSETSRFTITAWDDQKFVNQFDAKLEELDGVKIDHTKLINYRGNTVWQLSNETFKKTLRPFAGQTLTDADIYSARQNVYAQGWHSGYAGNTGNDSSTRVSKSLAWTIINGSTPISSVGYVGDFYAYNIYQTKSDIQKKFNKNWTIRKETLEKGMPLLAAEDKQKIEWTAEFSDVICYNGSGAGSISSNANEVDIYLATAPFTDEISQANDEDFIKFERDGLEYNYITTTNRKANIKFTMKKDAIVYMKAVPHWNDGETSHIDDWWDLYLNIKGSNGQWTLEKDE